MTALDRLAAQSESSNFCLPIRGHSRLSSKRKPSRSGFGRWLLLGGLAFFHVVEAEIISTKRSARQ